MKNDARDINEEQVGQLDYGENSAFCVRLRQAAERIWQDLPETPRDKTESCLPLLRLRFLITNPSAITAEEIRHSRECPYCLRMRAMMEVQIQRNAEKTSSETSQVGYLLDRVRAAGKYLLRFVTPDDETAPLTRWGIKGTPASMAARDTASVEQRDALYIMIAGHQEGHTHLLNAQADGLFLKLQYVAEPNARAEPPVEIHVQTSQGQERIVLFPGETGRLALLGRLGLESRGNTPDRIQVALEDAGMDVRPVKEEKHD